MFDLKRSWTTKHWPDNEGSSACKVSVSAQRCYTGNASINKHNCFQRNRPFCLHMLFGRNYEENCILARPVVILVCIAIGLWLMCWIDSRNWVSECASDHIPFSGLKTQWQVQTKKAIEWRATRIKPWTPKKCGDGERKKGYSSVNKRERSRFVSIFSSLYKHIK